MKKSLIAALIGATFATSALAQSSVQIYGIADAGVMFQKGGPTKIYSGGADGSRIGFKGTEDLGNGFKAMFNLEARVELDNGSQQPTLMNDNPGRYLLRGMNAIPLPPALRDPLLAGLQNAIQVPGEAAVNRERALFDRMAMVGLVTPVGAFLLGRMYTPGYEVFNMADTFESGTAGTWGHVTGGTAGYTALSADIRSQEAIQYRIALPNGIGAAVMYGGKNSGYLGRYNKFRAGHLTYKANGFDVGIGYNHGYDRDDRPSLRTTTVGGSYTLNDQWKFFAGFHSQRNTNSALLPDYLAGWDAAVAPQLAGRVPAATAAALRGFFQRTIAANTQQDANSYQIGLHYKVGSGRIMTSYAHQNDRTASNSDANLFAIGYDHFLSKRTDIYTVFANIKNNNEAQYAPGTAGNPGGFTKAPGEDGRALQVGIRHRF
ncbi:MULTISPECIES: porin [unclassified Massilia]|uniref:porin n=1 Tax=unclassified Massilia TaxID=2609279 RepID=UPI001B840850|nr:MULTISPECIES: porin [unclassified Massilia]MBQ5942042.1 porin [Massilia sp. AB1]MBQ5964393.1 porin [Massilia sp. ZL223]